MSSGGTPVSAPGTFYFNMICKDIIEYSTGAPVSSSFYFDTVTLETE